MYFEIKDLVKDKELPLCGTNDDGEAVVIEWSNDYNAYKVATLQHNGWVRVNYYYEDGTVEEIYEK